MTDLTIRALGASDMPAVMQVQAQCYTAIEPESLQSMRAKREAAPQLCRGAWLGGALIGYLSAVPVRGLELPALDSRRCIVAADADTLYLHDLALLPAARGSGAGLALVRQVTAAGARLGLGRALLVAIQGSVPYWRRHGFDVVAGTAQVQTKLISYGADARLMQRALP